MEEALSQLLAHGILGPILVVVWLAYRQSQKKLEETQEKRVSDAQTYAEKMSEAAKAVEANTQVMRDYITESRDSRFDRRKDG